MADKKAPMDPYIGIVFALVLYGASLVLTIDVSHINQNASVHQLALYGIGSMLASVISLASILLFGYCFGSAYASPKKTNSTWKQFVYGLSFLFAIFACGSSLLYSLNGDYFSMGLLLVLIISFVLGYNSSKKYYQNK